MSLLHTALMLAARGWHVFPLRPGAKRPAFPDHDADRCTGRDPRCRAAGEHAGWEVRATTDPDRIRRAWTNGAYNIGVATGPSGLVVVDLDMPKLYNAAPHVWRIDGVHDGFDVFAVVCERAGQPLPVDTFTVTTGRRGTHLYYRHPTTGPRLRNTRGGARGSLGWLIDTRAHGGYVVAPGSVVAGNPYTVAHDADAAPLPGWLADALCPAPLPAQRPVTVALPNPGRSAYVRAAVARELARITTAPSHHNDALYLASTALGQLVAGGSLDVDEATRALEHAGVSMGLKPHAVARTIASGFRAGARRPRQVAA